ncbi:hypothetical protein SCP_0607600 [Sparassis crispa]|uniref:Uncharacterized protein n=1 Tax=Sparassis crispa TaxID=139825 RepID=A0A401GRK2_9APHY|nr:hypothetical protein SCP_0607600 [Sparassis crispa]GBE84780.1 hypothetical protein SCP_0607600 [Sparassis crispa]
MLSVTVFASYEFPHGHHQITDKLRSPFPPNKASAIRNIVPLSRDFHKLLDEGSCIIVPRALFFVECRNTALAGRFHDVIVRVPAHVDNYVLYLSFVHGVFCQTLPLYDLIPA